MLSVDIVSIWLSEGVWTSLTAVGKALSLNTEGHGDGNSDVGGEVHGDGCKRLYKKYIQEE